MRFTIFNSPKAQKGELCTYEKFLEVTSRPELLELCKRIAAEEDKDKRAELKKQLPVITWQAEFPGRRLTKEAIPSGLFMLDIDHIDDPWQLYCEKVAPQQKALGIVFVAKTASCHGLRIVAKCLPTLSTLEDCQKWLASNLKVEYDDVCKDFARCSFVTHESYTYYSNNKAIWQDEPEEGTLYAVGRNPVQVNAQFNKALEQAQAMVDQREGLFGGSDEYKGVPYSKIAKEWLVDQREGLFGGSDEYKGVPYSKIAKEWLEFTGGEPQEGERNARLFKLATRLRYITDFNEATLLRVMPTYGLGVEEMKTIIKSAVGGVRASEMPRGLRDVLDRIDRQIKLGADDEELPEVITNTSKMPSFPPVIRQYVDNAPEDFKMAVALCQLPILGALGSKLRAKYLDGEMHEPSFQVSLEAPQASGKSFMRRLAESELEQMITHDALEREKELEYDAKVREMKLLNIKVNADNKEEVLGSRPVSLIRYCSPKMSITKLLMRLYNAQGLHLFAMSEEIDTVTKTFKSSFSSYSDLLRVAFDSGVYGQDYASENSFSGMVNVRYNVLFSGTPKAMRRFYPDVEDGLVSRVCFVTLPDQFGKPMPEWKPLDDKQKLIVDTNLVRLNDVSIIGNEVQPDHVMKLDWLNKYMEKWVRAQQLEAVKMEDRTRDIFCRRAAVVGFRAGMLAWFLWGEKSTPAIRKNVCEFSSWVANCMLNQHLLRFNVTSTSSNVNRWEDVFEKLNDEFSRREVEQALLALGYDTPVKMVLYKWKLGGMIEKLSEAKDLDTGKMVSNKFKKIK